MPRMISRVSYAGKRIMAPCLGICYEIIGGASELQVSSSEVSLLLIRSTTFISTRYQCVKPY